MGELQILVKNMTQMRKAPVLILKLERLQTIKTMVVFSSILPQYHSVAVRLPDGTVKR